MDKKVKKPFVMYKGYKVLDGITDSLRPGGKDYVRPIPEKMSVKKTTKGDRKARFLFDDKGQKEISDHMEKYGVPREVSIKSLRNRLLKQSGLNALKKARGQE